MQGKNNNAAASIGGPKITTNALSTNRLCLVTVRCHWFNNFPEYCGPESTYTERTSYIYEGDTIYDTDCGGGPTETYYSNNDPRNFTPCTPGWIYDSVEIVSAECQDDPTPPDTPPGDPGSGGGTGGDPSTENPYTVPATPIDPCLQKAAINTTANNTFVKQQIIAVKNQAGLDPNLYEYGSVLTVPDMSATLPQVNNTSIYTSNQPDYVELPFTWNATQGYSLGFIHVHPNNSGPSPADIFGLLDNVAKPSIVATGEAGIKFYKENSLEIVVTPNNGKFIVTINDWQGLDTMNGTYTSDPAAFNQSITDTANTVGSYAVALLLKFGNKINLYYSPQGDTQYYPVKVNSTNQLQDILCPQ